MRLLVIQHDHVSPPGPVAERFTERGYDVELHEVVGEESHHSPGVPAGFPDFTDYDAVVTMGAPWSTYDHELIGSWVLPELRALQEADAAGVPVLGICFGGQLLAAAHGGGVEPCASPEVGWSLVDSDEDDVVPGGRWFQWHCDTWRTPPEAREVARNDAASQAFVLRRNLAVQFHPELTSTMLAGWLSNGGDRKAVAFGLDPHQLLASARAWDEEGRRRAHRLVDGFLDRVAPARGAQASHAPG
jgi:GMP synthase-like glutamine amidotransferase